MATMPTGSRQEKQKFWQQHVLNWEESNLSQKAYCELHSLPLQSFGYWKRKLKLPAVDLPCFYPLAVPDVPPPKAKLGGSGLSLLLYNDRFRVEIKEDFSSGLLKKLVVALEQL